MDTWVAPIPAPTVLRDKVWIHKMRGRSGGGLSGEGTVWIKLWDTHTQGRQGARSPGLFTEQVVAEESLSTLGVSRQHWSNSMHRSQMGSGEEALHSHITPRASATWKVAGDSQTSRCVQRIQGQRKLHRLGWIFGWEIMFSHWKKLYMNIETYFKIWHNFCLFWKGNNLS